MSESINQTPDLSKYYPGIGQEGSKLYGLYLVPFDKFLLVHHDYEMISELQTLLSSKIQTLILEISACQNYYHNIIDNTICQNWTIYPPSQVVFVNTKDQPHQQKLIPCSYQANKDIIWLQKFAMCCLSVIENIRQIENMPSDRLFLQMVDPRFRLSYESLKISDYFDENDKTYFISIQKRLEDFEKEKQSTFREYRKICYWAKSVEEINDKIITRKKTNDIDRIFHKVYHGWTQTPDLDQSEKN